MFPRCLILAFSTLREREKGEVLKPVRYQNGTVHKKGETKGEEGLINHHSPRKCENVTTRPYPPEVPNENTLNWLLV